MKINYNLKNKPINESLLEDSWRKKNKKFSYFFIFVIFIASVSIGLLIVGIYNIFLYKPIYIYLVFGIILTVLSIIGIICYSLLINKKIKDYIILQKHLIKKDKEKYKNIIDKSNEYITRNEELIDEKTDKFVEYFDRAKQNKLHLEYILKYIVDNELEDEYEEYLNKMEKEYSEYIGLKI